MLLNCGVGEDSWESLGLQGEPTSQSWRKSVLNIHWKTEAGAKIPNFGHLMWKTDSLEKTLMLGKIEGRRRRGRTTEDEMIGWHHRLDVHEFEQAPGVGDGQGSLACCSLWGHKELDMTEQLNWIENNIWKYKTWNFELHKRNYGTMFMQIYNWIDFSKCDACPRSHKRKDE